MKQNKKFYEVYDLPKVISAARTNHFRKELLSCIDQSSYSAKLSLIKSVQFHISTPVLRSQTNRKVGRMSMFGPNKSTSKPPTQNPGIKKKNEPDKSDTQKGRYQPELPRLTISQKKLQHNAQIVGAEMKPTEQKSNIFIDLSASPEKEPTAFTSRKHKLQTAGVTANKKLKMKQALKYMIDYAQRLKSLLRNGSPSSPLIMLPTAIMVKKPSIGESSFSAAETAIKPRQEETGISSVKPILMEWSKRDMSTAGKKHSDELLPSAFDPDNQRLLSPGKEEEESKFFSTPAALSEGNTSASLTLGKAEEDPFAVFRLLNEGFSPIKLRNLAENVDEGPVENGIERSILLSTSTAGNKFSGSYSSSSAKARCVASSLSPQKKLNANGNVLLLSDKLNKTASPVREMKKEHRRHNTGEQSSIQISTFASTLELLALSRIAK